MTGLTDFITQANWDGWCWLTIAPGQRVRFDRPGQAGAGDVIDISPGSARLAEGYVRYVKVPVSVLLTFAADCAVPTALEKIAEHSKR